MTLSVSANEKTPLVNLERSTSSIVEDLQKATRSKIKLNCVYNDSSQDMTFSRKLARFLSKFSWYNPQTSAKNGGSLDDGWAYWEHAIIPRRFINTYDIAEPGETRPTKLYPILKTPEEELGTFGIGFGLYFSQLRILATIMIIAGLINIPTMMYFASDIYDGDKPEGLIDMFFSSSAMCSNSIWAPCPNCTQSQWQRFPSTNNRMASTADGSHKFIRVNKCSINAQDGITALATLVFLYCSFLYMVRTSEKRAVKFDEVAQTATDYSIEVLNPPKDSYNPDEWRDFFSKYGEVAFVTVAVNNDEIIKNLLQRRYYLYSLELRIPPEHERDRMNLEKAVSVASKLKAWEKLAMRLSAAKCLDNIKKIDEKLKELSSIQYNVSNIFVTFQSEESKINAMTKLSMSKFDVLKNNTSSQTKDNLFKEKYLLNVREPVEPSAVRWTDISISSKKLISRLAFTTSLILLCIASGMVAIAFSREKYGPAVAAFVITSLNTITPYICDYLNQIEVHYSEGSKEASMFFKMIIFLWTSTALTTSLITPFTDTLSANEDSIVRSLWAIYMFEICRGPVTQMIDIYGHFCRHVLAPREEDQRRINLRFQGASFTLSERCTDMVNILFLTLFYSGIFPAGFFLAAIALFVHYWTDKFCLLRNWAPSPKLGRDLNRISKYFIWLSLAIGALMSSYNFSAFPFDDACQSSTATSSDYIGTFTAYVLNGNEIKVTIDESSKTYFYCNQDMTHRPFIFPPVPTKQPIGGEWMSASQAQGLAFLGYSTTIILTLVACRIIFKLVVKPLFQFFMRTYTPPDKISNQKFTKLPEAKAYIPQEEIDGFPYPVLFCKMIDVNNEFVGFTDTLDLCYACHNSINDVSELSESFKNNNAFSVVKQWHSKHV